MPEAPSAGKSGTASGAERLPAPPVVSISHAPDANAAADPGPAPASHKVSRRARTEAPEAAPKRRQREHVLKLAAVTIRLPVRRHSWFGSAPASHDDTRGSFLDELRAVFYAPRMPGDKDPTVEDYNDELHSDAALLRRESLRFDPDILQSLLRFWAVVNRGLATEGAAASRLRFERYKRLHFCVYKALHESWEPAEALRVAVQDWELDSAGHESLSKARFMRCMFEIADVWTSGIARTTYLSFLRALFRAVTKPDKTRGYPVLRDVEEVVAGGEMTAIGDWLSRSARAKRRFALRMARAHSLRRARHRGQLEAAAAAPASTPSSRRASVAAPTPSRRASVGGAPSAPVSRSLSPSRPRPRRPSGVPSHASVPLLYGWPLIRALRQIGPGFPRRLQDGGRSATLVRCAQQALAEMRSGHAGADSGRSPRRRPSAAVAVVPVSFPSAAPAKAAAADPLRAAASALAVASRTAAAPPPPPAAARSARPARAAPAAPPPSARSAPVPPLPILTVIPPAGPQAPLASARSQLSGAATVRRLPSLKAVPLVMPSARAAPAALRGTVFTLPPVGHHVPGALH